MTDKELKRLSRAELLELLLIQTRETEKLRAQLEEARQKLADRHIAIEKSGDLAQAVLRVNSVVGAADAAAKQYLYNVAAMEKAAKERCRQMLLEAAEEADRIRGAARCQAASAPKRAETVTVPRKPEAASAAGKQDTDLDTLLREAMMLIGK